VNQPIPPSARGFSRRPVGDLFDQVLVGLLRRGRVEAIADLPLLGLVDHRHALRGRKFLPARIEDQLQTSNLGINARRAFNQNINVY